MAYRILIIAPDVGLDTKEEIINIASGFEPTILWGTVTRQRALVEIASGKYDIIHFATHGKEHVLKMSDGIIEGDLLEHAIGKAENVRALFLNACRSMHTSAEVYNATHINYSIGWPSDVGNDVAQTWARLFFEALRIDPTSVKKAAEIANDAIVKSYHVDSDELPVVLNGRVNTILEENRRLQAELARAGMVRVPTWMVVANALLIIALLLLAALLATLH